MSKKTLYFDNILDYTIAAATENGRLAACDAEKEDGSVKQGNIYRGVITAVQSGMQAAFVDCGLERNCFLPADDVSPCCPKDYRAERLQFKEGDEVVVQVVKPPAGKKGAKVTTRLSFAGKSVIYLPETDFVGVSHKITDSELKQSLVKEAARAKRQGEGIVIRSAAPFSTYGDIVAELNYLRKLYEKALNNKKRGLIYADYSLPLRVLRDNDIKNISEIIIGSEKIFNEIKDILPLMPDSEKINVQLYAGGRDMLDEYGVLKQIIAAVSPRVEIEGGANLVIERTEALTVIDVNTGGFTGGDNLEETVYQTNLAAAREIARQVKLRNIGGIVVVDFIDMKQDRHRQSLAYELNKALQKDSAQCKVLPMSDFGLIEFTRRRTGKGIGEKLTMHCSRCGGKGYVPSGDAVLIAIRAEVLRLLSGGAPCVEVVADCETAERASASESLSRSLRERFPSATVTVTADAALAAGEFTCRAAKHSHTTANTKIIY